ncbi:hypothetical protein ASPTUDRAFT_30739 [Aspergillus tubingensis CBS 134.48]|uniref:Uncharacterized protein n=1 Tax=Aspergillus tubingensis (strain CBS 134.48) TaxID=767770 RepID=A0A1L9N0M7_ASPTC|nr:hypothetical protein ASPTUDRAFT_30739 [Aspergillus tubingensis CBS 134.48]
MNSNNSSSPIGLEHGAGTWTWTWTSFPFTISIHQPSIEKFLPSISLLPSHYSVHKSRKFLLIDRTDVIQIISYDGFRSSSRTNQDEAINRAVEQSSSHLHVPVFGSTGMFTDTLSGWDRPPPTADLDVKQQQQPNTYGVGSRVLSCRTLRLVFPLCNVGRIPRPGSRKNK